MKSIPDQRSKLNLHRLIPSIQGAVSRYRFALGAFLIPLVIRTIPELISGPYPVGWDVITYYVPNVFDIASGSLNIWGIIASTPVMYGLVVPIYVLTRISPVLIFKIMGPLLYGFLGLAIFTFCKKRLQWLDRKSFFAVLFVSAYFVMLRISWDAYRMELGLVFLLLAESLTNLTNAKTEFEKAGLYSLAVLSNQLVGAITVVAVAWHFLRSTKRPQLNHISKILPIGFYLLIVYATLHTSLSTGLSVVGSEIGIASFPETTLFLAYAYIAIIPFMILGLKFGKQSVFAPWVAMCVLGIGLSILPGQVFQDIGYRWVLLLSIPFLIVAYEGFSMLQATPLFAAKGWTRSLRVTVVLALAISSTLFVILPSQIASPFYTAFPNYGPSSMVQSSLPSSDYSNVANAMLWVNGHTSPASVVIAQQAFYGWARVYLSTNRPIVNSFFASPSSEVNEVGGYAHVYTVFWTQGNGWFQNSFPVGATQLVNFGDVAVFQYR